MWNYSKRIRRNRLRDCCCWIFCPVFQKSHVEIRERKKQNPNWDNLESVNRLAVLHGFKAAVITEKQTKNKKKRGELVSVIQPTEKEEKMAPKIAKCFTVVQVAENHPTVKMERTSGETREVILQCVCQWGRRENSQRWWWPELQNTQQSAPQTDTTEAFSPHLRSQTHIRTKAGIYMLPLFCCRF